MSESWKRDKGIYGLGNGMFYPETVSTESPTVEIIIPQDVTETITTETIEGSSDVKDVIQGIEELVQQTHDNTINSLKGLLKDRFNYLLEYPYEYSKGYIESFLSDLIDEIEEF